MPAKGLEDVPRRVTLDGNTLVDVGTVLCLLDLDTPLVEACVEMVDLVALLALDERELHQRHE